MKYIIDEALNRAEIEGRSKPSSVVKSDEELVRCWRSSPPISGS